MKNWLFLIFSCLAVSLFSQEIPRDSLKNRTESEDRIIDLCEEDATFPGGNRALAYWMMMHLVYPQSAIEKGLQGRVYIGFIVEMDGTLSDIRILRGIPDCPECDAAALRMVKAMPSWDAAHVGGKPVRTRVQIPVHFSLM